MRMRAKFSQKAFFVAIIGTTSILKNALFLADVYLPTPRLDGDQTPASIVKMFVERAQDAMGLLDSGIEEEQLPTGVIIQAAENPRAFVNELVKETRDGVESGATLDDITSGRRF